MDTQRISGALRIPSGGTHVEGLLASPEEPRGIIVFAHGSGSGRLSPRNNYVARELRQAGFATLLMDLLTPGEDSDFARRFDIDLLAGRLADAVRYLEAEGGLAALPVGVFGASTGAAAALRLAAAEPGRVGAVVSRGGRPDLAHGATLAAVRAPTLLIVGGLDFEVIKLNQAALRQIDAIKELTIVPGATHLFEEPGALERVAVLARSWFDRYLAAGGQDIGTEAE